MQRVPSATVPTVREVSCMRSGAASRVVRVVPDAASAAARRVPGGWGVSQFVPGSHGAGRERRMNVRMNHGTAKALVEVLQDAQPGSDLASLKDELQKQLGRPQHQLTREELVVTMWAVSMASSSLERIGNPTATDRDNRRDLLSAWTKLKRMLGSKTEGGTGR